MEACGYESRKLIIAMDIRSQCGHDQSTKAVSACLWPRHVRQQSCQSSEVSNLPHPEAHSRKDTSKDMTVQAVQETAI